MSNSLGKLKYGQEYFDYLISRGFIRTLVRKLYLKDIRKYCIGRTIDFGCGTGSLLAMLPQGSIGYEINDVAVNYCRLKRLEVEHYDPETDDYELKMVSENKYSSFTMNHVLEHLNDSQAVIRKIFRSCYRLGIKRIVFTVPGSKCFRFDETHQTFVDKPYFQNNGLLEDLHYKMTFSAYFPFNIKGVDRYFRHNELRMVFDKR
jgi:SAM-dependent methyltransferase